MLCSMWLAGPDLKCWCLNAKMQSRTIQIKGGLQIFQNWTKSWNQVKKLCRLKVRDFVIPGKMQRRKENQESGSCTVPFEKFLLLLSLEGSSLLLISNRTANLPVSQPRGFLCPCFIPSYPYEEIPNQAKQPFHTISESKHCPRSIIPSHSLSFQTRARHDKPSDNFWMCSPIPISDSFSNVESRCWFYSRYFCSCFSGQTAGHCLQRKSWNLRGNGLWIYHTWPEITCALFFLSVCIREGWQNTSELSLFFVFVAN